MFNKNKPILGLDIGRLILQNDTDTDVPRGERRPFRRVEGSFEGVRELKDRFDGQVALVSKCGGVTQIRTRECFDHTQFYEVTGVNPNHVFFCEERKGKAAICDYLGVTHFADDRLQVLGYLHSVKHRYLFNAREQEIRENYQHLPYVVQVANWEELLAVCYP